MHRRAMVLVPCLIPCHRCEDSSLSRHFWSCNVTTSTREPTTRAWISAEIWRQDGPICSKNRKIVHRLPKRCMRQLLYIENCMGKSLIVKKNCVNNYLNWNKVYLPQMCHELVFCADFKAILTPFSKVIWKRLILLLKEWKAFHSFRGRSNCFK